MRKMLIAAFFIVIACPLGAMTLPDMLMREVPGLRARGDGTMRFFGMKVYDIRLWIAAAAYSPREPFALELVYDMNLKGKDIAVRSVKEMRGLGYRDENKLNHWEAEMTRIFPDVKPGDTLIGLALPGKEARFYNRDKFIATVADPEFVEAFFGIWLSEKTSAPSVRKKLLETN